MTPTDQPFFPSLCDRMTCGPTMALALQRDNAVQAWRQLIGPTDPSAGRPLGQNDRPATLRGIYGLDVSHNGLHGSDSDAAAARELELIWPSSLRRDGAGRKIDGKYEIRAGRLVKRGTHEPPPEDEPLFLFRAKDRLAKRVLEFYRDLCTTNYCSDTHTDGIQSEVESFAEFAKAYPERTKKPDDDPWATALAKEQEPGK